MSIEAKVQRIRQIVEQRRTILNPCLSADTIRQFEASHGISLPEEYKLFLMHLGNGGEGPPKSGIEGLGGISSEAPASHATLWRGQGQVGQEFPFSDGWSWGNGRESAGDFESRYASIGHGSIYIGNDGAGQCWLLVVNGKERGNVWQLTPESVCPTIPRYDFLTWYQTWLDSTTDPRHTPLPFDISYANGKLNLRCSEVCSRLSLIDARNLVAALGRTITSKHLQIGQTVPLTTSEIELQNFSEFVNFKFNVATDTGPKQAFIQVPKQQVPILIANLKSHLEHPEAAERR